MTWTRCDSQYPQSMLLFHPLCAIALNTRQLTWNRHLYRVLVAFVESDEQRFCSTDSWIRSGMNMVYTAVHMLHQSHTSKEQRKLSNQCSGVKIFASKMKWKRRAAEN